CPIPRGRRPRSARPAPPRGRRTAAPGIRRTTSPRPGWKSRARSLAGLRRTLLEPATVARHGIASDPVDEHREQERLQEVLLPCNIGLHRFLHGIREIEDRDDDDERGVL